MPVINAKLINLFQELDIVPDQAQTVDFEQWLKTWTILCSEAIATDAMHECFNAHMQAQINLNESSPFEDKKIQQSAYMNVFFTDLLFLCHKELGWFPQLNLSRDYIEEKINNHLELYASKKKYTLREYYQAFCAEWFKSKLKSSDPAGVEAFYITAFKNFLEAFNLGLVLDFECKKIINEFLDRFLAAKHETVHVIQDNCQLIHQFCMAYLLKNDLLPAESYLCQHTLLIKRLPPETLAQIRANLKINELFNACFRLNIINDRESLSHKKKKLRLILESSNDQAPENKKTLIDLIATDQFEAIETGNQTEILFSYQQGSGIEINKNYLDAADIERIALLEFLERTELAISPTKTFCQIYFSLNVERRLHQLATSSLDNLADTVSLDNEKIKFSHSGRLGIKVFLNVLNVRFMSLLESNKTKKGFVLLLPGENHADAVNTVKRDVINGINDFLTEQHATNDAYIFCCQHVHINLDADASSLYLEALAKMLLLLDKSKLNQLSFHASHLEVAQMESLATALQSVHHTTIRFVGLKDPAQALSLEAINDSKLQPTVPYSSSLERTHEMHDVTDQPKPVTLAKIQALLAKRIELQPIQTKMGIQTQHHYEHQQQVHQQTEVKVLQSWQIEQNTQTQVQDHDPDFMFGDERHEVINWTDIKAAFDPKDPNHAASKLKLGEEILNYRFKDRGLMDLWQRITGDIKLSNQDPAANETKDSIQLLLRFFSPYLPKQITYKTLLTIVRHPHLFQDGIDLTALAPTICFSRFESALFTDPEKRIDQPSPFRPRLISLAEAKLPSAEYLDKLKISKLPSQLILQALSEKITPYAAWHAWRRGFVALNSFSQKGVEALTAILNTMLQKTETQQIAFLTYFVEALNYYHYDKAANGNPVLRANQLQFEYKQQKNYQEGCVYSLSPTLLGTIPEVLRSDLHRNIVAIFNQPEVLITTNEVEQTQSAYPAILFATLQSHQEKLPPEIKLPYVEQEALTQLVKILGCATEIKLMELALSNSSSVVHTIFSMLREIENVWGEVGLTDFNRSFMAPHITLAGLAEPNQQGMIGKLLQLTPVQYHWWQQLTMQHTAQSGFTDFAILMQSFQHFLDELAVLKLSDALPMPCPIQGICHFQVALNRILTILKFAKKPAEQMRNLEDLNWSADGVIQAVQEVKSQYVTGNMQFNVPYEKQMLDITAKYFHLPLYQKFSDYFVFLPIYLPDAIPDQQERIKLFEFLLCCFYRYMGSQKYAPPMQVCQQMLDAISLPANIEPDSHPLILCQLLPIIARTITGPRCLDRLPQQEQQRIKLVKDFVQNIYACVSAGNTVNYKELHHLLHELSQCVEDRSQQKDLINENNRLDLNELNFILQMLTQSCAKESKWIKDHVKESIQISEFLKTTEPFQELHFGYNPAYGFFHLRQVLTKYQQYFIDSVHRIHRYNKETHYYCFIEIFEKLKLDAFSPENKGRLFRLFSLFNFQVQTYMTELPKLVELIKHLSLYQEQAGPEGLDTLLKALSSIVPRNSKSLEIERCNALLATCITKLTHHETVEIPNLISENFPDYREDCDIDDIKDTDFYPNPSELEKHFPGLGMYYAAIKTLVLQRYPVSLTFGVNKLQVWNQFLTLLADVKNSDEQLQILNTLLQTEQNIDLASLILWLPKLLRLASFTTPFNLDFYHLFTANLLMHPQSKAFSDQLAHWSYFPGNLIAKDQHCHFIELLNKIATLPDGFLSLDNFYQTASRITCCAHEHQHAWFDDFNRLLNCAQSRELSIRDFNQLLECLAELSKDLYQPNSNNSQFQLALLQWLKNIEANFDLTLLIAGSERNRFPQQCYHIMLVLMQVNGLILYKIYDFLKTLSRDELIKLATCYQTKPIPRPELLSQLITNYLTTGKLALNEFIAQHTSDPHHERTQAKLQQQFDHEILWPYINRAKYLEPNESANLAFSPKLYAQYKFINYLGETQFRHLSLSEIGTRLHAIREFLQQTKNSDEIGTALLTVVSLVREAIYKTSEAPAILWPTPVQILAILCALNHSLIKNKEDQHSLFMQLAMGEGKSLLDIFLSILKWAKEGNNVAVITHRASLGLRDVLKYAPLFESINIRCKHLTAKSYREEFKAHPINLDDPKQEHNVPSIYFVEFNALALIRQQHLLDTGKDIEKLSFIIDEADQIFNSKIDSTLTRAVGANDTHPHAWAFSALAAYIETLTPNQNTYSITTAEMIDYLRRTYPLNARAYQQVDFLAKLPLYLQAVWQARTLVDQVDFLAKPLPNKTHKFYGALIIDDNYMPPNVTFNGLIQQGLHGLLNHRKNDPQFAQEFPLAPETKMYATMHPEAVLHWINKTAPFIALSATTGCAAQRLERQQKFNLQFIKLPKREPASRVEYPVQFCPDQDAQMRMIAEICTHYIDARTQAKSRTILIAVSNIAFAEKLKTFLNKAPLHFNPQMLHAALEDISDATLGDVERACGRSGHILIAVAGLIVRGFDVKLDTAKEVVMINTSLIDGDYKRQMNGRVNRVNPITGFRDKGKCYEIYNRDEECKRYPHLAAQIADISNHPELFIERQFFANFEHELNLRLPGQLVGISKNLIQENYFSFRKMMFELPQINKEMRDEISEVYSRFLEIASTIMPGQELGNPLSQGDEARAHYNASLLSAYAETLESMQRMLGDKLIHETKNIISHLLTTITEEQRLAITHHQNALATGPDTPGLRVYNRWKRGVPYNAYVDHGKQSFGNYAGGLITAWCLPKDARMQLQAGKKEIGEKIARRNRRKFDFISQLHQMLGEAKLPDDLFARYLNCYQQKIDSPKTPSVFTLPINYYEQFDENTLLATKVCGDQQAITLVHDPLIGKACQISLTSNKLNLFEQLQQAIIEAYHKLKISAKLVFHITKIETCNPCLYQLLIDFSSHEFDSVDREKLLAVIAEHFKLDVKKLLHAVHLPSIAAMQNVLRELHARMRGALINGEGFQIPDELVKLMQQPVISRNQYYENVFIKTIGLLKKNASKLPAELLPYLNAVSNFNQDLCYFTKGREQTFNECKAYAPPFEHLSNLVEHDQKRKMLEVLNKQIKTLSKHPHDLLLSQQAECLMQLAKNLVTAPKAASLLSVYSNWQQLPIHHLQQDVTFYELMQQRKQKSGLFSKPPEGFIACKQIEEMLGETQRNLLTLG